MGPSGARQTPSPSMGISMPLLRGIVGWFMEGTPGSVEWWNGGILE
jgi:hypothetical protein